MGGDGGILSPVTNLLFGAPPEAPEPPRLDPSQTNYSNAMTLTRQRWTGSGYVTEEIPDNELTPEQLGERNRQREEEKQNAALETELIDYISVPYEQRLTDPRFTKFEEVFSSRAHALIDPEREKRRAALAENREATGMTGSRSDVDMRAELEKEDIKTDKDISEQAQLYKEGLINQDIATKQNLLGYVGGKRQADKNLALSKSSMTTGASYAGAKTLANIYAQNASSIFGNYSANANRWKQQQESNQRTLDTAGGLAYLYGGSGGGGGATAPGRRA